jgi:putative DNA primase/helicase
MSGLDGKPARGTIRAVQEPQKRAPRKPNGAARPAPGDGTWRTLLLRNREGRPKGLMANAEIALRTSEEWSGRLAYDRFAGEVWDRKHNQRWTDLDDLRATAWMQHEGITVTPPVVRQAAELAAADNVFHPVRDYLDALVWDGVPRLDGWVIVYLGARAGDGAEYLRAVGSRWMMSAVARVHKPGCKADCLLVLEGAQGALKSTALSVLAGEWFTDELAEVGSKDAALQLSGVWIIEIAELDSIKRRGASHVKSYLSRTHDRFRPPYGRNVERRARQTIFAATTNETEWGQDDTGLRRFWPITCGTIDIPGLNRDRDQLWAEARDRFLSGEPWWLDTESLNEQAKGVQDARQSSDTWLDIISEHTSTHSTITIAECLNRIGLKDSDHDRASQMRVAKCLTQLGFKRYSAWNGGRRQWRYRREQATEATETVPSVPT